jgi:hypothetical protein
MQLMMAWWEMEAMDTGFIDHQVQVRQESISCMWQIKGAGEVSWRQQGRPHFGWKLVTMLNSDSAVVEERWCRRCQKYNAPVTFS